MTSSVLKTIAFVAAGLSVIALADMPYGFYTFLRLSLTLAAVILAVAARGSSKPGWIWPMIAIALVWNPLIPVFFDRSVWAVLNVAAAVVFVWAGSALASRTTAKAD
jgi:hypothetical protein